MYAILDHKKICKVACEHFCSADVASWAHLSMTLSCDKPNQLLESALSLPLKPECCLSCINGCINANLKQDLRCVEVA